MTWWFVDCRLRTAVNLGEDLRQAMHPQLRITPGRRPQIRGTRRESAGFHTPSSVGAALFSLGAIKEFERTSNRGTNERAKDTLPMLLARA